MDEGITQARTLHLSCPHCGLSFVGREREGDQFCPRCIERSGGALSVTLTARAPDSERPRRLWRRLGFAGATPRR